MSLTAFKRKSVINHGSKRSGKGPGGIWLPQGPFEVIASMGIAEVRSAQAELAQRTGVTAYQPLAL